MSGPFDIYPAAESLAFAGIAIHSAEPFHHRLSSFIEIVPRKEELDLAYLPRAENYVSPFMFTHYLLGAAADGRYYQVGRKINTVEDACSSITLAYQSLCIYHCCPYVMGPVYGFRKGQVPLVLQVPETSGTNWEHQDPVFRSPPPPFFPWHSRHTFDAGLNHFFGEVSRTYAELRERRWMIAASRFTSALNGCSLYAAIVDLAVSVEALLPLKGDQVGFQARLYLALLVGSNYQERKQIEDDMREFYKLRSAVVHGSLPEPEEKVLKLLERIALYVSRALKKTCGRRIESEILTELDYIRLVGTPCYSREKVMFKMKPQDLAAVIAKANDIERYDSCRAFLSEPDEEGYRDLMIELKLGNKTIGTFEPDLYIMHAPQLQNVSRWEYWVSQDADGDLTLIVTY